MNVMRITSRDNSLLRQARAVRDGKIDNLIFVEGLRLCEEALRSELDIEAVIFSEEIALKERAASVIDKLSRVAYRSASVSEKLLETVSYTKSPQGIILIAKRPVVSEELLEARTKNSPLLIVMHRINNPVNVGAIIRTAEAAGASLAIATQNTSDPYSPKALRGAMGSAFRLPVWTGSTYERVIQWCKRRGIKTVCADASGTAVQAAIDWTTPAALIVGPESAGLSEDEVAMAEVSVRIPMQGMVESLNVSVAAGILLFEAARQREKA